jgi:hypothetical protein
MLAGAVLIGAHAECRVARHASLGSCSIALGAACRSDPPPTRIPKHGDTWSIPNVRGFQVDRDAIYATLTDKLVRIDRESGEMWTLHELSFTGNTPVPMLTDAFVFTFETNLGWGRLDVIAKQGGEQRRLLTWPMEGARQSGFAFDMTDVLLPTVTVDDQAIYWEERHQCTESGHDGVGTKDSFHRFTLGGELSSINTRCTFPARSRWDELATLAGPYVLFGQERDSAEVIAIDRAFATKTRALPIVTARGEEGASGACGKLDPLTHDDRYVYSAFGGEPGVILRTEIASGARMVLFSGMLLPKTSYGPQQCIAELAVLDGVLYWSIGQFRGGAEKGLVDVVEVRAMPATGGKWKTVSAMPTGFLFEGDYWWSDRTGIHRGPRSLIGSR